MVYFPHNLEKYVFHVELCDFIQIWHFNYRNKRNILFICWELIWNTYLQNLNWHCKIFCLNKKMCWGVTNYLYKLLFLFKIKYRHTIQYICQISLLLLRNSFHFSIITCLQINKWNCRLTIHQDTLKLCLQL